MKKTINFTDFQDAFIKSDREDSFSFEALQYLFNYFEKLEEEMEQDMELDVIDICCTYEELTYKDFYLGDRDRDYIIAELEDTLLMEY